MKKNSFLIPFYVSLLLSFILHAEEKKGWETTKWLWNFGIIQSCDVGMNLTPAQFFAGHQPIDNGSYNNIKENDLVWVRCCHLPRFNKEVLPKVKTPFVLVITDGDESFPSDIAAHMNIEEFIENPNIIHIFAQNCDYKGPSKKVSHIPIGMDFHTIGYKPTNGWGEKGSPKEQEVVLEEILQKLEPTKLRKKKAFVDFQLSDNMRTGNFKRYLQYGEDRTSIFNSLKPTGLIDHSGMMRRSELWKTKGQYAFSISPHGNGIDCHRTWEDLVLGCIVIVKSSSLDPMYKDLPVVIVKDWSEITPENMDKWLAQYGDAFTNPAYREKLTNAYWLSKIRASKR